MREIRFLMVTLILLSSIMIIPVSIHPNADKTDRITVMTYNIHQWFVEDPDNPIEKSGAYIFEELLKIIRSENPDIIGLQESEGTRFSSGNVQGVAWLAEQLNMYYYYAPPTSKQIYGTTILSTWPIIDEEYRVYPRPEGIERAVAYVVIDSPFGRLRVFNTHFEISRFGKAQVADANYLVNYVGSEPAIITGDFNSAALRNQEAYYIMNNTFTYAMLEAGIPVNDSRSFTSPASAPQAKIDYIWLSKGDWKVFPSSFKVIGNVKASDHLGVVVDLLPQ